MTAPQKPLLRLVLAERRIKQIEPRDLNKDPFMLGEGIKFFTPARVAQMAQDNDLLRKNRKK